MQPPIPLKTLSNDGENLDPTATSKYKLSDVVTSVVENYNICEQNSNNMTSLQSWIREQQTVKEDPTPWWKFWN